jgi:hypothetical protein
VVDVFGEVDEQLRSEQIKRFYEKYLPGVLGALAAALVLALGYWGWTSYRTGLADKASAAYGRGVEFLSHGDAANAQKQFQAAADAGSASYRWLALQQEASMRLDQGKTAEAVALFDQSANTAPDPMLADAARLKSALALIDTASYADVEKRLLPLTDAQRPFSASAREALAFAKLKAGDLKSARNDFQVLTLLPGATDDMRTRAQAAIAMIDDGSAAQLGAAVKAALNPQPSAASLFQGLNAPALGSAAAQAQPGSAQ